MLSENVTRSNAVTLRGVCHALSEGGETAGTESGKNPAGSTTWKNLVDTRKTFPHADQVKVKSERTVTVFNICGNDFRLITAIHYDRQKIFVLNFLTHAEYTKDTWKGRL